MIQDLRYAIRQLYKNPSFTFIAIITLALGIGSSTAIFSVLDSVLLRPLPYPQQERIVELRELDEKGEAMSFSEPNFDDLHARSTSFEALAKYSLATEAVAGGSEPVRTKVCAISDDFFRVLGVRPLLGRLPFSEAGTEGNQVVVVSYGFWKRLLAGRNNLEGTTLRFANRSFAVIGVLPPNVEFPPTTDVWVPLAAVYPPNPSRTGHNFRVAGKMRADISLDRARAETEAIGQLLKIEYGTQTDAASFGITPLRERMVKDVRGVLLLLCGAVGLLLVIACSNVANLLVVRATARRKETALRAALGASQWRLARQFLVETVLLTLSAGALGVLLAFWGVRLVVGLYQGNLPRVGQIDVNSTAIIFALGVSVLVGVVLGLVPALSASRRNLSGQLQDTSRGTSSSRSTFSIRNFLVIFQVALTLMLLVGAGLLGRSFERLLQVDPGFEAESAVVMMISRAEAECATCDADDAGKSEIQLAELRRRVEFYRQLIGQMEALPGVMAVGGISSLPMSSLGAEGGFIIEDGGKPAGTIEELIQQYAALAGTPRLGQAGFRVASAGYFAAMKIPLLRGRVFQESDGADAPHVALVSEAFVRRFWPNENPIGKELQFGGTDGDLHILHVIGVVGDVREDGLDANSPPTVYVNYIQRPGYASQFALVLRGQGDRAALITAMRRVARGLDSEMPTNFQTIEQVVSDSLDSRRFSMVMLVVFSVAALAIAMVGLYGIMSYICWQRTTEIGIRMALGAQRSDMLQLILRQSLVLVGAGIAAGVIAAAGATRLLGALLYGVGAADLLTYGGVIVLLTLAALAASYLPARRAMKLDPLAALRHD